MRQILDGFPRTAHPMAVLTAGLAALAGFYPVADSQDPERIELEVPAGKYLIEVYPVAGTARSDSLYRLTWQVE